MILKYNRPFVDDEIRRAFARAPGIRMPGEKRGAETCRGSGSDVMAWIVADKEGFAWANAAGGESFDQHLKQLGCRFGHAVLVGKQREIRSKKVGNPAQGMKGVALSVGKQTKRNAGF